MHTLLNNTTGHYKHIRTRLLSIKNFIELANKDFITDVISYQEILMLKKKHGIVHPSWLTSNRKYRMYRGWYRLPSSVYETPYSFIVHKEYMSTFMKLIDDLDALLHSDEHKVLLKIYGKHDNTSRTNIYGRLTKIGYEMGLSKQRIFQLHKSALKKLEINSAEKMMCKVLYRNAPP
jgi:hypothetical protein